MSSARYQYTAEELQALRPCAPSLSAHALEQLGSARVGYIRNPTFRSASPPAGSPPRRPPTGSFARSSPPRQRSPELVPADASWIRPHPLLDGELEPSGAIAIPGASEFLRMRPSPGNTPSSSPPPGFGPVAKVTLHPKPGPAVSREVYYKSRVCKGPDMSANFASRIRFREKMAASRKLETKPILSAPTRQPVAVHAPQQRGVFDTIEEQGPSHEIDRLFSKSSSPPKHSFVPETAPLHRSHAPAPGFPPPFQSEQPASTAANKQENPADELSRWFKDITRNSAGGTTFSSEADKLDQQKIGLQPAAVATAPKPFERPTLAPSVLSFFDSIKAQAVTVGQSAPPARNQGSSSQPLPQPPSPPARQRRPESVGEPEPQSDSVRSFFDMFTDSNNSGKPLAGPDEPVHRRPLQPFHSIPPSRHQLERDALRVVNGDTAYGLPRSSPVNPPSAPIPSHTLARSVMTKTAHVPVPAPVQQNAAGDLQRWFADLKLSAKNAH